MKKEEKLNSNSIHLGARNPTALTGGIYVQYISVCVDAELKEHELKRVLFLYSH